MSVWWVWSVSVRAGSHRFFLPMSVRRNLLMSVWTELACFLASVFLVSSIGVCLKCFPLLVCQYLSSGATWFLSGFFLKIYWCLLICCPAFWTVLLERTENFLLICIFICSDVSPCICLSWYPSFFTLLGMPTGCLFFGSFKILFQELSDLLLVFLHKVFYQDCTSLATCK